MKRKILNVLLIDDHAVVREGLRSILESSGEIACTQAGTAEDALQLLDAGMALDVMLVDISLPGMSGLDALAEVHKRRPKLPVLLISMFPEEQYALRALRMGAAGYLCKSTESCEVVRAVEAAAQGDIYLSRGTALQVAKGAGAADTRARHDALSNREFMILRMIGAGNSVSQIAVTLGLSVKTVSTYRERIFDKMSFASNYEIIRYALQEGLLE
jgi:DNA-binding NarL/FixJ family response regulator